MRRTLSVSVSELNPGEFTARLDQLIAVYAAAMRPPAELLTGRRSIMAGHTVNPGFRALAVTDDGTGEAVGFGRRLASADNFAFADEFRDIALRIE